MCQLFLAGRYWQFSKISLHTRKQRTQQKKNPHLLNLEVQHCATQQNGKGATRQDMHVLEFLSTPVHKQSTKQKNTNKTL
jgi:hypothetical protein